jgi:hypothetical protein
MAEVINERLDVLDGDSELTVRLEGNRAAIYAGGNGHTGSIRLRDDNGVERFNVDAGGVLSFRSGDAGEIFEIDAGSGTLVYRDAEGRTALRFVSGRGSLELGAAGNPGRLLVRDGEGEAIFEHNSEEGYVRVGGEGQEGGAEFTDSRGETTVQLDGGSATVKIGAEGNAGGIKVLDENGGLLFQVTATFARLRGTMIVGARDAKGEIGIMDSMGRTAIHADGDSAKLQLGNIGNAGDLTLLDNEAKPVLTVDGLTASLAIGADGKAGHIVLRDSVGAETGRLSGKEAGLFLGRKGKAGEIMLLNKRGQSTFAVDGGNGVVSVGTGDKRVVLDGSEGDIKLSGADCAEEFESADPDVAEPGTVVVIAGVSALGQCTVPYDTRVAGVVSGAEGARPGIVLNHGGDGESRVAVALNGRVSCRVDAGFAPIEIGDLLTTSPTRGHAMKADDVGRTHGAILGKALGRLDSGTGMIPVLVSLI